MNLIRIITLCTVLFASIITKAEAIDVDAINYNSEPVYDYPINNPYAATVITVPPEMKVEYKNAPKPEEREIRIYPDREIPEGFWYENGFKYSVLLQKKPADLVYVIAGTGADIHADKMLYMAAILYKNGFSVVLLPSPTHQNFIINASSNFITGNPRQDALDLYKVMQVINQKISSETQVTGYMLAGYSLGAMEAAFTAKVDDEEKVINFKRVLLINPPYNLYEAVHIIDNLLYGALPQGVDNADAFIKSVLIRLSSVTQSGDALDFSNEKLLLDAYNKFKPSDGRLQTTIGLSFRLSAASMIFAADVMGHRGYIFPKNQEFTTSTHLSQYMETALRTSFKDYFDDLYSETYLASHKQTKGDLARESSLDSIKDFLTHNKRIGLITNRDDIILTPGDIDKLSDIFGNNAVIFSNGGHVGNMTHPAVAYYIVKFMKSGWQ